MRRHRKFPLVSTVILVIILGGVVYQSYLDVDLVGKAFSHLGSTVGGLFSSMRLISHVNAAEEGVAFSSGNEQENTEAIASADEPSVNGGLAFPATASSGEDMPLLVNGKNPLPDDFAPKDLVNMRSYCDLSIVKIKGSEIEGERHAVDALMSMLRAAIDSGVSDWQISAGYRSISYQRQLWDNKAYEYRQQGLSSQDAQIATAKYVAVPGASEHHTGLAFDVTVPGESFPLTEQSKWLAANCWEFGFIIRYTDEKQPITGINAEPWHIRYVGQPHARLMRDNNWCLEEYVEQVGGQ